MADYIKQLLEKGANCSKLVDF